ncbi:hypothetical protein D9M68_569110 [compost metagenome]
MEALGHGQRLLQRIAVAQGLYQAEAQRLLGLAHPGGEYQFLGARQADCPRQQIHAQHVRHIADAGEHGAEGGAAPRDGVIGAQRER